MIKLSRPNFDEEVVPIPDVSCSVENLTIHQLLAPYFCSCRISGFSSWPNGVMVVRQVFIILEKNVVQLMYSVRKFLLGSASGFSHFHYAVGWSVDGQFKKFLV